MVLDGYLPSALIGPTQRPVFILRATDINADADQCRLWNSLRGPKVFVNLNGGEHLTPSDAVWLAKFAIQTGPMGPDRSVSAISSKRKTASPRAGSPCEATAASN